MNININITFIIAQIFGIIALALICLGYLLGKRKSFLWCQIFANLFYALQYFLLLSTSGAISAIVSTVKNIMFFNKVKEGKEITIKYLIIFILITLTLNIPFINSFIDVIPILNFCIFTYGTWQKNLKISYGIGTIVAILWIIYNFFVYAYVAAFGSILEAIASIVGLIKLFLKKSK